MDKCRLLVICLGEGISPFVLAILVFGIENIESNPLDQLGQFTRFQILANLASYTTVSRNQLVHPLCSITVCAIKEFQPFHFILCKSKELLQGYSTQSIKKPLNQFNPQSHSSDPTEENRFAPGLQVGIQFEKISYL